jgi:hypothetical protein
MFLSAVLECGLQCPENDSMGRLPRQVVATHPLDISAIVSAIALLYTNLTRKYGTDLSFKRIGRHAAW